MTTLIGKIIKWVHIFFSLFHIMKFQNPVSKNVTDRQITSGNVVRANQSYANEILTGASSHELQNVNKFIIKLFTIISRRESTNGQCGSV